MTVSHPTRRVRLSVSGAVTAALAAAVLAGCGSDGPSPVPAGGGGGTPTSASASPSPSPTDGRDLVQSATDALDAVDSFHIEGNLQDDGDNLDLDIAYGADSAVQGTLDGGDGISVELRSVDGTLYANGTSEFYAQAAQTDDGAGADLSSIAGKWVVIDSSAPSALSSLAELADRDALVASLAPDSDSDDTYELSGPEDVEGVSSYIVTDADGATFAVAAEGDPLPVQIKSAGTDDDDSEINFDGYGDDVEVEAPDASEIVEIPA